MGASLQLSNPSEVQAQRSFEAEPLHKAKKKKDTRTSQVSSKSPETQPANPDTLNINIPPHLQVCVGDEEADVIACPLRREGLG